MLYPRKNPTCKKQTILAHFELFIMHINLQVRGKVLKGNLTAQNDFIFNQIRNFGNPSIHTFH